jgi:hypothetical protein
LGNSIAVSVIGRILVSVNRALGTSLRDVCAARRFSR